MPRPKKGETKAEYIARAIREFKREGFSDEEAKGRAYGFWETYKNDRE